MRAHPPAHVTEAGYVAVWLDSFLPLKSSIWADDAADPLGYGDLMEQISAGEAGGRPIFADRQGDSVTNSATSCPFDRRELTR